MLEDLTLEPEIPGTDALLKGEVDEVKFQVALDMAVVFAVLGFKHNKITDAEFITRVEYGHMIQRPEKYPVKFTDVDEKLQEQIRKAYNEVKMAHARLLSDDELREIYQWYKEFRHYCPREENCKVVFDKIRGRDYY